MPEGSEAVSVRLNVDATGTHAPFLLAKANGWYEDEGLAVKFGEGNGSDSTVALIDAGDDDIGIAGFDAVAVLRSKGAAVKVVGGWEQRSPLAIVTAEESEIQEPTDLEGATVVMDQGDIPLFEAYASRAGIDASAVDTVTMTEAAQSAALAAGRIDGILGWTTYHSPQVAKLTGGVQTILWSDSDFELMNLGIIANDDTIANDSDMLCGFVRASYKGLEAAQEDPDGAIDALVEEFPNLDPEIAKGQLVNMFELLVTDDTEGKPLGWVAESDIAEGVEILSEAGNPIEAEPADLFDNSCYPDA
ncbi:MAG: ABC transporter substrate-binding protein [Actinomycetales bacterium]|nr:ABC transporter substrate-binding protein [Actinomycetales bacterium]